MAMSYPFVQRLTAYLTLLISISWFLSVPLRAQEFELTVAEAKAHFSLEIIKQIEFPEESSLEEFTIAIVGGASELHRAFDKLKTLEVRGKGFKIELLDGSITSISRYPIIYIASNKRSLNRKIYGMAPESLIIVDGYTNQDKLLVSLAPDKEKIKVSLNRDNLTARGFVISAYLLEFAGTREDLTEELRERESALKDLLQKVDERESELALLSQKLEDNIELLNQAKRNIRENHLVLEGNQQRLAELNQEMERSALEIGKNQVQIAKQQQLMNLKQAEVKRKAQEVAHLQQSITDNQQVLQEQYTRIAEQTRAIENRDETIDEQRSWMTLIIAISGVFFIMIYVLLKMNNSRRKAHRELKLLNSQLYELATTDGLTHLYNRRYFLESAQRELLREQRKPFHSVLLMIDIDNFKSVNDNYGHPMGDKAIKTVADLLKEGLRKYDIVGRLGGEEYAMLMMDCDLNQARDIAERLCEKVSHHEIIENKISIKVTVSIGISRVRAGDTSIEQSISRADKALYEAKAKGRNRVEVFEE